MLLPDVRTLKGPVIGSQTAPQTESATCTTNDNFFFTSWVKKTGLRQKVYV